MRTLSAMFRLSSPKGQPVPRSLPDASSAAESSGAGQLRRKLSFGSFQTLGMKGDYQKRPGHDRIIQCRVGEDMWLFGVVDGHGNELCAEYLAEALPRVASFLLKSSRPKESCLREAFDICANEWDRSPSAPDQSHSGAVALLVLVDGDHCYIANAGDCRCVYSKNSGSLRAGNVQHRTTNVDECVRVRERGGTIRMKGGIFRVEGALVPTRVFGDIKVRTDQDGNLKHFLHPEPDITIVQPEFDRKHKIASLVIASDGLWDATSDSAVAKVLNETFQSSGNAESAARSLAQLVTRTNEDDISVIVLTWKQEVVYEMEEKEEE